MEKVFTHPSLVSCLSKLPTRSPKKQMNAWIEQKRTFQRTTALIRSLGKPTITKPQAKRLDDLGFTYEDLVKLRSKHKDREVFQQVLKSPARLPEPSPTSAFSLGSLFVIASTCFFQPALFRATKATGDFTRAHNY